MRVYFEKPRTTVGWKGLINDPNLDDSFEIEKGLKIGRPLLRDILALGLPTATEALDSTTPQYLHDFIGGTSKGPEPPNHKPIVKWQVDYQCPLDLKMQQMEILMLHCMAYKPLNILIHLLE